MIWWSPLYISPEQTIVKTPTIESDIYALGIVLYELLTGKPPFISNDIHELLKMHRETVPVPAKDLNFEVSEELNQVVMRAIEKKPQKRYSSMTEFRNALVSIRQSITMRKIAPYSNPSLNLNNQIKIKPVKIKPENDEAVYSRIPPIKSAETALSEETPRKLDIATIVMAFFATLAIAGLIPFWIYIYFNIPGK